MDVPSAIVPYRPTWPSDFRALADYLRPFLAEVPHRIEHIGSTSVPGLDAKPIIDIDVVVPTATFVGDGVAALTMAGYAHQGDLGIKGREAFDVLTGFAYHHLYLVVAGSDPHNDHVDLRDYLRSHPAQADRYAATKRALSPLLTVDRQQYVDGKGAILAELLMQARAERGAAT